MRSSDGSSDVCSSDRRRRTAAGQVGALDRDGNVGEATAIAVGVDANRRVGDVERDVQVGVELVAAGPGSVPGRVPGRGPDRKSVVYGRSVSARVDFGGRGIIKKKKITQMNSTR